MIAWLKWDPYNNDMICRFFSQTEVLKSLFFTFFLIPQIITHVTYGASIDSLEKILKENPDRLAVREALGRAHFKNKEYKKVIEVLAPYSNEISLTALVELAEAYGHENDPLNETRMLQLLVERDPDRFRPHYLMGLAHKKNKKWDESAKSLRRSIELAPRHRPSYEALFEVFTETKQNYEARTVLSDMIKHFGRKKEYLSAMCKLLAVDNFLDQALDMCKSAVRAYPKFPENHIYLAQTYYNLNNKTAAEKILKTSAQQFKETEFVQYAAGEFYLNEKNYQAAVRYLEQAVKLNPKSLRAQLTLALALYESRQHQRALDHFIAACKMDLSKETVTALRNSAAKLRQQNQNSMAEDYDRKASTCQPLKR